LQVLGSSWIGTALTRYWDVLLVNRLPVVEAEMGQVQRLLVVDEPQPGLQCFSRSPTSRFRGMTRAVSLGDMAISFRWTRRWKSPVPRPSPPGAGTRLIDSFA
jgi:hypothetical protein